MRHRIAATLLWLWFCVPLFAAPEVQITNRYRFGIAPAYTTFLVRIDPHAQNRRLCIWWGQTAWDKVLWNKSCQDLNGLEARRVYQYLPTNARVLREAGEWTIEAELIRTDKTYRDRTTITVIGGME